MAGTERDSGDLPFLPHEWLQAAEGVAVHSLGLDSASNVPPNHRSYLLDRVGEQMKRQGVVPPEGWQAALAKLCGWDSGNA